MPQIEHDPSPTSQRATLKFDPVFERILASRAPPFQVAETLAWPSPCSFSERSANSGRQRRPPPTVPPQCADQLGRDDRGGTSATHTQASLANHSCSVRQIAQ